MMIRLKDFQMPKRVEVDQATLTPTYGKFVAEPFERGYGITIGNALRRVLLSSIPGAAVTSIRIEGVLHEFSTIPGVKEDVTDIVLNVKSLRLKLHVDKTKTLYLQKKGPGVARAGDIIHDADVEILNPDHVIATLEKDASIDMEMTVKMGRGYVPAERNKEEGQPIGVIPIDSIFTPIRKVNYTVENARVGRQTDYDRLVLEVWTDGSITPEEAVRQAAQILKAHLNIFSGPEEEGEGEEEGEPQEQPVEASGATQPKMEEINKHLFRTIDEMEFSVRVNNCLKNANIHYLADLVQMNEEDLLKTKNFGRKSLNEIKAMLAPMGLSLGMKLDHILKQAPRKDPQQMESEAQGEGL